MARSDIDRMSNLGFRMMTATFAVFDFFYPRIDKRMQKFGVTKGLTVVDYGCGPGRYTLRFSKLVGESGKVYAVDVHELAVEAVKRKIEGRGLKNVVPVLARGYDSGLPQDLADMIFALDMFFGVSDPTAFLGELQRISKPDGLLILDDGHQSRATTKDKLLSSGYWSILEESKDHLKCLPIQK